MDQKERKIDMGKVQDITVQLTNTAKRMDLIEDLHGQAWGEKMEYIVTETVREIAGNALADVQQIFQTLDEHTNVREFMDGGELEIAFPENSGKEAQYGSQNPREETR